MRMEEVEYAHVNAKTLRLPVAPGQRTLWDVCVIFHGWSRSTRTRSFHAFPERRAWKAVDERLHRQAPLFELSSRLAQGQRSKSGPFGFESAAWELPLLDAQKFEGPRRTALTQRLLRCTEASQFLTGRVRRGLAAFPGVSLADICVAGTPAKRSLRASLMGGCSQPVLRRGVVRRHGIL